MITLKKEEKDQLVITYLQGGYSNKNNPSCFTDYVRFFLEANHYLKEPSGDDENAKQRLRDKNEKQAKPVADDIVQSATSGKGYVSAIANMFSIDTSYLTSTPEGKLFLEFYHRLPDWYLRNSSDCTICLNLGDQEISNIKNGYGISRDEVLLFKRDTSFWSTNNQGLVITNWGIHVVPDNDDSSQSFSIEWQAIEKVTYKETMFYFTMHDGTEPYISWKFFFKGTFPGKDCCTGLAIALTDLAQIVDVVPDAWELFQNGKVDEALSSCDNLIASDNIGDQINGHFTKGRILFENENSKDSDKADENKYAEAQKELETAYNMDEDDNEKAIIQYWLAPVKICQGDITARNSLILGMEAEDNDMKDDAYDSLQKLEDLDEVKQVWDNYVTERPYKQRKFIMPVKDKEIGGCVADDISVFRMSNIPSCIKFPMGHPIANQLYIGHPYNPQLYVPYEESEDIFFVDKVHELCYLLECLGAEEISITSVKGKSVEELNNVSTNVGGSADIKLFSSEGNVQQAGSTQKESKDVTHRTMKMVFEPTRKPYVPNGLIWYEEQPQWKRLVQSRIQGNMLEYNEFVSSSSTKFVSTSEKRDVTASARYLWMKVHADVDVEANSQLRDTEDTQWKVEVRFRSSNLLEDVPVKDIKDMDASNPTKKEKGLETNGLTENEAKYFEEVKFCLEDGPEIDPSARKFLERLRKRYEITPERATEIEDMAKPKLTDEETEYVDVVKDVLADGEMSPRDRKLLNRLRDSLGISEERAQELEKLQ